jgi:SAM-dependent methyltransferase
MNIKSLRDAWERWGQVDPMWAAVTAPDKADGRWSPDEFFVMGEREISEVIEQATQLGMALQFGSALDFGCGAGRLTQALGRHFDSVVGVDIAPSMLAKARELSPPDRKLEYVLNQEENLGVFEDASFDFVYSNLTLLHMPPRISRRYLTEFARVVKSGGCVVFQMLSGRRRQHTTWRRPVLRVAPMRITDALVRWKVRRMAVKEGRPVMEIYAVPKREVVELLRTNGLRVVLAREREEAGSVWLSCWYFATKEPRDAGDAL